MKEKKWEPTDPNWSRVHVGGLDITVKWRELKKAFTHCGRVLLASIVHGRGFGFVTFATQEEARNAISDMNGRNSPPFFMIEPLSCTVLNMFFNIRA